MIVGVIGTGLMGSSLARCLTSRGYSLVLYNRTRSRAEMLAGEIGGVVVGSPVEAAERSDVLVLFISGDDALYDVVYKPGGLGEYSGNGVVVLNASTVTPMASLRVYDYLSRRGIDYLEAPVYGSVSEAMECRLYTLVAGKEDVYRGVEKLVDDYSFDKVFLGKIPAASVLKLALNNIGLAMPAILAESLALLKSWGLEEKTLLEVSEKLWFGEAVKRYWNRIFTEKPPRFKVWMAGKDYRYIAEALREKKQPAILSSTISTMYYLAAKHGLADKDYPQIARYYIELAEVYKNTKHVK